MPRRTTNLALTTVSAIVLASLPASVAQTVPTDVKVPSKVDLPLKNFNEVIPGTEVKFDMVFVPGGEFLMGSPDSEAGREANEGPQHKVKLRPFWLAKCEVTWDEYYSFWKDEGLFQASEVPENLKASIRPDAITRPTNTYVDELYDHGRDGFPAICMTHHAAMMYCQWLRWKTKKPYRLPTEAEWEYACRAGTTGAYGFDDQAEKLDEYAWFKANSADEDHPDGTTHKVGTKKANAFGLHDMHGNVWEWCLDHYDSKAYAKFPTDKLTLGPVAQPTDKKWPHVVRGGSWADKPDRLRSAARRGSDKSWIKHDPQNPTSIWWLTKLDVIGFRVALPADEYPELIGLKPLVAKQPD
jgi:formylglycine-generating enzyme required for sulfatase activity